MKLSKNILFLAILFFCGTIFFNSEVSFGEEPRTRVVMLGDSLTAGGSWAKAIPWARIYNMGIGGDTTADVLKRLPRVVSLKPDIIFLQIGINELGPNRNNPMVIIDRHLEIWDKLQKALPQVELIITGLFPVKTPTSKSRFNGWNTLITELNVELKKEAELRGLTFMDLTIPFSDPQGSLLAAFTFDGLHLTSPAYKVWSDSVLAILLNDPRVRSRATQAFLRRDKRVPASATQTFVLKCIKWWNNTIQPFFLKDNGAKDAK